MMMKFKGFALCTECNHWLTSYDRIENHVDDGCYVNADEDAIREGTELYTEAGHDTVTATTPVPGQVDDKRSDLFFHTLKESLCQGILVEFGLDE